MELSFTQWDPTGNITVLVETPVPRREQPGVAARLLGAGGVGGEQAGFLEPPSVSGCALRLQMMGGEFCGNATMSAAALLARREGLQDGAEALYLLEVSGADGPVSCRIRRSGDAWEGTVCMPLPEGFGIASLDTDAGPLSAEIVHLPGISHLILPSAAPLPRKEVERRLPEWCAALGAAALGALVWNEKTSFMDPTVCVPSAGTVVREHGCGSGTAALAARNAMHAGRTWSGTIHQPGGSIRGDAVFERGAIRSVSITGLVRLSAEGIVRV